MSSTTLLGIVKDGTVEAIEEYGNGHGAGPFVWHIIATRGGASHWMMNPSIISSGYLPKCTKSEAWALAMTFDNCIIRREDADVAAKWLKAFLDGALDQNRVNHWPKILAALEDMPEGYDGIAIHHTSISECRLHDGVYDEETEENRPYDINTDSDHFFLTEALVEEWMSGSNGEQDKECG